MTLKGEPALEFPYLKSSKMSQHWNTLLIGLGLLLILSKSVSSADPKPYVVYMGAQKIDSEPTLPQLNQVLDSHHDILASTIGSVELASRAMIQSYQILINGFAAVLTEQDAAKIAENPEVVSVFPDRMLKLHTAHSWEFMALENNGIVSPSSLWTKASYGEDVIVANLDTGVWPESKSFSDEGFGPVPSRWRGKCEDSGNDGFRCNKKLIGARYFNKGFYGSSTESFNKLTNHNSTRDTEGHGTHTLSTAGGNFVRNASIYGISIGTTKGGASKARVAAYKVCWPSLFGGGCTDSDSMQGFAQAVLDGVDVISMSVGGPPDDYLQDGIAIGAFTAVKKRIVVICSAGNEGPSAGTVTNNAPWIITVAASSTDRDFESFVELGNGLRFKGSGFTPPLTGGKQYTLINSLDAKLGNASSSDASLCYVNTLDPAKVKGKILVCLRGGNGLVEKGQVAISAGASGMIICNDQSRGNDLTLVQYDLPATQINYEDGQAVFSYMKNNKNPVGYITPAAVATGAKPSPKMALFSSRGPNTVTPQILKPDITAPGMDIIASNTETPPETDTGAEGKASPFIMLSGTSMSCPHVSGVVALLKKIYPDWSPAAIKSAIMTTARTKDNTGKAIRDHEMKHATPFSYGAGHINPNRVLDPGLVYDLTVSDYLDFLCANGYNETTLKRFSGTPHPCPKSYSLNDFNYPSITIPNITSTVTATRKVKNVGSPGTYTAKVVQPAGVLITVKPSELKFDKVGEEKSFKMIFTAKEHNLGLNYVFGKLTWTDGKHQVRSPIVASVLST